MPVSVKLAHIAAPAWSSSVYLMIAAPVRVPGEGAFEAVSCAPSKAVRAALRVMRCWRRQWRTPGPHRQGLWRRRACEGPIARSCDERRRPRSCGAQSDAGVLLALLGRVRSVLGKRPGILVCARVGWRSPSRCLYRFCLGTWLGESAVSWRHGKSWDYLSCLISYDTEALRQRCSKAASSSQGKLCQCVWMRLRPRR